MIQVREVKKNEKQLIDQVTDIHLATFAGFFLSFMGRGFLRQMYTSYCEHSESKLLVAISDEGTIGFLAYSADMSGLYKYMIKHKILLFAWYSLGAFLRKPAVFMRLLRAFLKPSETKRNVLYVELASIGVAPSSKSHGVGSKLIDEMKKQVDLRKYEYIALETDAENNDATIHFYEKNGFIRERVYETNEGRKMYEYRYSC